MSIFIQLIEIITLRRRPQDISYDEIAAGVAFISAIATAYFQVVAANAFSKPLPFVLAQGIFQALVFFTLLLLTQKQGRFVQTCTALFGVAAILQFLGLLIFQLPGLGIIGLLLTSWNFFLMIIILRDSIESSTVAAVIITIAYHVLLGLALLWMFPEIKEQFQAIMNTANSV